MFERDFFLRESQLLAQAVGKVLTQKKKKRYNEALEEAGRVFGQFYHTDSDTLRGLQGPGIISLCQEESGFFPEKGLPLAELMKEEGDIASELGNPTDALNWYEKSLALYEESTRVPNAVLPLDIYTRINYLREMIASFEKDT